MLNRRILRIKAFKVLYSNAIAENMSLAQAQSQLDVACEATRDLYIYMLGIVSPLTKIAQERIEAGKSKFNPTEEERNPNMKFAENALAKFLDEDVDFQKVFKKKKFEWMQYDLFLKKVMTSVASKEYYAEYMASDDKSLAEDCKLFTRIFEEEFVDSEELEKILEDKSLYWNDDLAYSLTWCCKTLASLAKGESWEAALRTRQFEDDRPNFTPRISGIIRREQDGMNFAMSILKSAEGDDSSCERFTYAYSNPIAGRAKFIHTYNGDGNPLPSFEGEPKTLILPDVEIDELTDLIWTNLNADNKVSLFVRYIDIASGECETRIVNKNV